jgi:mono/diheme cytochrome c family protein
LQRFNGKISLFWRSSVGIAAIFALGAASSVVFSQVPTQKVASLPSRSAEQEERVDYFRDVKPILLKHCYICHGPSQAESGLRLDLRSHAMRGGDGGAVIVGGNGRGSKLIQYVSGKSESGLIMPPKERGDSLSENQIAILRTWIDQGAVWPDPSVSSGGNRVAANPRSEHWAFQPVQPVRPPVLGDPWINTPIDAFVLAKLQQRRLRPNPEADRIALLRRVTFDLIGLPPTPDDVQVFLDDTSSDAYERVVDRLLASQRFGERWGRHWLDLARYADTDGFELDHERKYAYKYRDYVIASFNDDKPFDQFILEQLAADELAPRSSDESLTAQLAALGFCRNGPTISNQLSEKNRVDEVDDMVSTTSAVFLGLTVGCARCHDHKYEPISQRDYYRMFAVFNTAEKSDDGEVMHLREPNRPPRKTRILSGGESSSSGEVVSPGIPEVLDDGRADFPSANRAQFSSGQRTVLAHWISDAENPLTARVIVNRVWLHHFGRGIVNTPSNFGQSGDIPSHPELLDYLAGELVREGWRLKRLHKQIVMSAVYRQSSTFEAIKAASDPHNELYWRYPLRRLEAEAIRDTILAASGSLNLQMYGPGIKPRVPTTVFAAGQESKWPKVQAEGPEHWRRSIYIFVKRSLPLPMLEGFDAPATTQTCERRQSTIVATQALQLMNDDFTNEQAARMADRIAVEVGDDIGRKVDRAYRLALSRSPTEAEQRVATEFVEGRFRSSMQSLLDRHINIDLTAQQKLHRDALADLCHVLFNTNEFVYLD